MVGFLINIIRTSKAAIIKLIESMKNSAGFKRKNNRIEVVQFTAKFPDV